MKFSELLDFSALEHLAKALWRDGEGRGAALLVGSGFSRFARLPSGDSKKAPLWDDLKRIIVSQIYAGAGEPEIPTDTLRLAEEYRAMLGQAALDDFIRAQIPDQSWEPGEMHELLLRLPWADMLTTNWDTLLERAAARVGEIAYETVSTANDLARARPPRIVKLHGTLPSGPFVFAEEDYRTYPVRYAAFVNLARQVFLENELCLLGFSGNDPNFLQWSGWVRDHLGGGARRIYLVGVLNLQSATRRLLELRNVAPIDLAPLVATMNTDDCHAKATQLFLDFLHGAKPRQSHTWTPGRHLATLTAEESNRRFTDKTYAAELLAEAADRWRTERESYPGWLICPSEKRLEIRHETDGIPLTKAVLEKIESKQRPRVLFELAWRFDRAYWPVPECLFDALYEFIDSGPPAKLIPKGASALSLSDFLGLAVLALRAARHSNKKPAFCRLVEIIERHSEPGSDFRSEVAYQKCLAQRDDLQYADLIKELAFVQGPDPIWKLRQANIRCELSDFPGAKRLVLEALAELRSRQQRDRNSLWLLSRRAWAEFLAQAADLGVYDPPETRKLDRNRGWSLDFKAAKCDPWDELRNVEDRIDSAFREQEKKSFDATAHFDAGTYVEGGTGTRFLSSVNVPPSYELDRLAEDAGLPVSFDMVSIRGDSSKNALAISFEPTEEWYLRFFQTLRSHKDDLLERYLDRVSVAKLPAPIIEPLIQKCMAAIQLWRTRTIYQRPDTVEKRFNSTAIEKIRLLVEVVSRLVIRSDYQQAKALYDFAVALSNDATLQHWWLWEPTSHLLKRCSEAMTDAQKAELALSALQFPLPGGVQGLDHDWPRPFEYVATSSYDRADNAVAWNIRISELIQAVSSNVTRARSDAALRLLHLHERRLLTAPEQEAFGAALYTQQDEQNLPANTNLYPFVFLNLPAPDPGAVKTRFANWIYPKAKRGTINQDVLISIKGAALRRRSDDVSVLPSREDGLGILDAVLAWRPKASTGPIDFERERSKSTAREIGPCIVHAIIPLLTVDDLTPARVEGLFRLITDVPVPSALQTLPLILSFQPDLEERVTKAIRRALFGGSFEVVSAAANAVERWIAHPGIKVALPRSLIEQLIHAVSARQETGLASLLWGANRLVRAAKLTLADEAALAEALADLYLETQYDRVDSQPLQISLSVIRTECVRLASQLAASGIEGDGIAAWLESYKFDPLPEVRFALDKGEEQAG